MPRYRIDDWHNAPRTKQNADTSEHLSQQATLAIDGLDFATPDDAELHAYHALVSDPERYGIRPLCYKGFGGALSLLGFPHAVPA